MSKERVPKSSDEGMVLVGFGKNNLIDMLEWQDTDKEQDLAEAFVKWPPIYRREDICSQAEVKAACQYLAYLQDLIVEYELNKPSEEDKEK
jgi:hypothetical protein